MGRGLAALRPIEQTDRDFILWLLKFCERDITAFGVGSTFGAIRIEVLKHLEVPLPPLVQRKHIAVMLNEQMEAVEQARAAIEDEVSAASRLAPAYLMTAFTNRGAQLWGRKRLVDLCDLLPSRSISTNADAEVDVVATACLSETGFNAAGIKKAHMWKKDAEQCRLASGEILVARSNTPELVGRVALYTGEPTGIVASDLTIRIAVNDGLLPEYLAYYLSFLFVTGYWKERAGGASGSMKKITRKQILEQEIPVPDTDVQRQVVSELKENLVNALKMKNVLTGQREIISKLAAALLRRVFNRRSRYGTGTEEEQQRKWQYRKRLVTQQSVNAAVKNICDIMRRSNCAGALQYAPELTWILFLRILDERETREAEEAEAVDSDYRPSLEQPYRWQDWAAPNGPNRRELNEGSIGGFFSFVNTELIPHLKGLKDIPNATPRQKIMSEIFSRGGEDEGRYGT